jgi:HEAT repeat protein
MRPKNPNSLATVELLEAALEAARADESAQSEPRWRYVRALHARPEKAVFARAVSWCKSPDVIERVLGADVLAQLGAVSDVGSRPFGAESAPLLVALLGDGDARVAMSSLFALGHLGAGEPVDIAKLSTHRSAAVRHAVAYALGGRDDAVSVRVLIKLSKDRAVDVRDWATFGVGSLCSLDTPELREALVERLSDVAADVRAEAMVGLASRGDLRAAVQILEELGSQRPGHVVLEAAEKLLLSQPKHEELRRALSKRGPRKA